MIGPIKKTVNRLLARYDVTVTRAPFPISKALDLTGLLYAAVEREADGLFYVLQIGANDGVTDDPVNPHAGRADWRLLAVEPLPATFKKLEQTYSGYANVTLENVAVGAEPGELALYVFDAPDDRRADRQATADPKFAKRVQRKLGLKASQVRLIRVPMLTPRALLERYQWPRIDYLQIDTEGMDLAILETVLGDGFRPAMIRLEWDHLTIAQCRRCATLLANQGYAYTAALGDIVAADSRRLKAIQPPQLR